ncbi:hypothetical protein C5D16_09240 [Rathayibacter toxicus]|nr:hypothetical protein C5D15_09275 [Rathayibacter toxicus]PPG45777.1 hypothetical protein C5D16_09240 [Rathayibacter toxicus]PPI22337.1 hypothetical protein C5D55_09290 [Rathayibacter toxicus]PPI44190.1 hypothetical protein C5D43_09230 [Rathayibacter toxicus]PPI53135.1 hypothetical protein C5D35_09365 [Rathayibacter toxicus]
MSGVEASAALRSMSISVLGVPFRVVFGSGISLDDATRITASWASCSAEHDPEAREVVAEVGIATGTSPVTGIHVRGGSIEQLEETLTSTLTIEAIGERREDLLMLHACGMANDDGRVLAFVAASGTGKTTISRALGTRYGYITDETVAVMPDGRVIPYPKPLSVKPLTGTAPKSQLAPDSLALLPVPETPLVLAGVVLLERRDPGEVARFEQVDPVKAIEDLVPQTSYLSARKRPITDLVQRLTDLGGVRRLVYSEAAEVVGLVEELFSSLGDEAPAAWREIRALPLEPPAPVAAPEPGVTLIARAPTHDALALPDGELLVFCHNQLVRLSGIGPSLWRHAGAGITSSDLVKAVRAEVGAPPPGIDPEVVVAAALDELEQLGIIVRKSLQGRHCEHLRRDHSQTDPRVV